MIKLSKLRSGQVIAIGKRGSSNVSLICQVESVTPSATVFWVINGDWRGRLESDGSIIVYIKDTEERQECDYDVLYYGAIPAGPYADRIEYVETQLKRGWVSRQLHSARHAVSVVWKNLTNSKICLAYTAVKDVFAGRGHYTRSQLDDTIPF